MQHPKQFNMASSSRLTFIPHTYLRVADTTGVVTKANKIYEIKSKTMYNSAEAWCAAKGVSTDQVAHLSINGFDFPQKQAWSFWARQALVIIRDAAPQLLRDEAVKAAYNALVATCRKYKANLRFIEYLKLKQLSMDWFSWEKSSSVYSKLPGYFYPSGPMETPCDLLAANKALCDLVLPSITPYILKEGELPRLKAALARNNFLIECFEKRAAGLERDIQFTRTICQKLTAHIAAVTAELEATE